MKLADFGLTKYGRYEKQKTSQKNKEGGEEEGGEEEGGEGGGKPALQVVGSPNYIPVEVLRQEKFVFLWYY